MDDGKVIAARCLGLLLRAPECLQRLTAIWADCVIHHPIAIT